ncbi:MAG TPA: 3-carboxy-cis,cis-muconate cycloisomerase [Candidatus Eisenbacteria bacterium]|nr:3-carboxy-cis,cis-muconate cycloisomerase [Candidatus Eisenbacteria bacterium]
MNTVFDSTVFGPLFKDAAIASWLSDDAHVRMCVAVEAALARVQGRLGVIPAAAAEEIAARADAAKIELPALAAGALRSGFPIAALVEELRRAIGAEAGRYLHWGATTQDIMDTASVLQLRSVIGIIDGRLVELILSLSALADRFRATVMAGRTHGQQALPITFGLKAASWLAPFLRHRERLAELSPRLLVVQLGGAAGTLAALGERGLEVARALAAELGLGMPLMPWHAQRDGYVEFAGWLSLVTGSAGKMAQDVILLAQGEVAEVAESAEPGRGGSSTMPQKSNPITSELIVAAARANAALVSAMHQAAIQEHERGTHGWQVEWLALPQMIGLAGGALKHALELTNQLAIDAGRMRENIARSLDLILAEAAVFALSAAMPRPAADELVKKACAVARRERKPLIEVLRGLAIESVPEGSVDWQALSRPENYLGETDKIVAAVLGRARALVKR